MLYKSTRIKAEWQILHTQTRRAWLDVDAFCVEKGFPGVTITDVGRTPSENFAIYLNKFMREGMPRPEAEKKAAARFTWHFSTIMSAADGRGTSPWTEEQYTEIFRFVMRRCGGGMFEILEHDVGQGRHIHIAFRDYLKRREWEQKSRSGAGAV